MTSHLWIQFFKTGLSGTASWSIRSSPNLNTPNHIPWGSQALLVLIPPTLVPARVSSTIGSKKGAYCLVQNIQIHEQEHPSSFLITAVRTTSVVLIPRISGATIKLLVTSLHSALLHFKHWLSPAQRTAVLHRFLSSQLLLSTTWETATRIIFRNWWKPQSLMANYLPSLALGKPKQSGDYLG